MYSLYESNIPAAYEQALKDRHGDGLWEAYYNIAEELEELRQTTDGESPQDVATRIVRIMKILHRQKLAQAYLPIQSKYLLLGMFPHWLEKPGLIAPKCLQVYLIHLLQ